MKWITFSVMLQRRHLLPLPDRSGSLALAPMTARHIDFKFK